MTTPDATPDATHDANFVPAMPWQEIRAGLVTVGDTIKDGPKGNVLVKSIHYTREHLLINGDKRYDRAALILVR